MEGDAAAAAAEALLADINRLRRERAAAELEVSVSVSGSAAGAGAGASFASAGASGWDGAGSSRSPGSPPRRAAAGGAAGVPAGMRALRQQAQRLRGELVQLLESIEMEFFSFHEDMTRASEALEARGTPRWRQRPPEPGEGAAGGRGDRALGAGEARRRTRKAPKAKLPKPKVTMPPGMMAMIVNRNGWR